MAFEETGGTVTPETTRIREDEFRAVADVLYKHVVDTPGKVAEVKVSGVLTPRIVEVRDPETGEVRREYAKTDTPAAKEELEDWQALIANVSGASLEKVVLRWRPAAFLSPEPARERPAVELLAHLERYGPMAVVSFLSMLALFFLYGLGRRVAQPAPTPIVVEAAGREEIAGEPAGDEEMKLREMQGRIRLMTGQDPRKVASLVKRWLVREG